MIASLAKIFGSRSKAQEILYLLHDLKPIVRQGYYEEELTAVEKYCSANGLHLVKSAFKILLEGDSAYSNKGLRLLASDARRGMYFVYISKEEKKALLASYYEAAENQQELGRMLGYPDCCITFFCENFSAEHPNLEHHPTNPLTNITQRDKDIVLLSHFPCSADCEESIKLAQKYLNMIQHHDPLWAEQVLLRLG
ncbi:MAG: DUF483 domain-containing protein, partial [Nanoarchaeota archaeon]